MSPVDSISLGLAFYFLMSFQSLSFDWMVRSIRILVRPPGGAHLLREQCWAGVAAPGRLGSHSPCGTSALWMSWDRVARNLSMSACRAGVDSPSCAVGLGAGDGALSFQPHLPGILGVGVVPVTCPSPSVPGTRGRGWPVFLAAPAQGRAPVAEFAGLGVWGEVAADLIPQALTVLTGV